MFNNVIETYYVMTNIFIYFTIYSSYEKYPTASTWGLIIYTGLIGLYYMYLHFIIKFNKYRKENNYDFDQDELN